MNKEVCKLEKVREDLCKIIVKAPSGEENSLELISKDNSSEFERVRSHYTELRRNI